MGGVRVQLSLSLDGYGAGVGTSAEHPLGVLGERLHEWVTDSAPVNRTAGERTFEGAGAVVIGRTMLGVGLGIWAPDDFAGLPVFVPTHRGGDPIVVEGGSTFTLVARGCDEETVRDAVREARHAAGGRDVVILGGPTTARQALAADLVDELRLQVVHTLLGQGERLFDRAIPALAEFVTTDSAEAAGVTHVTLVRK